MRYIDADKLMNDFYDTPEERKTWSEAWWLINHAPTADVRENVRGEWIDAKYPFSKCSICGCYFDTANNEAKFCPNCGADMRREDNGRDEENHNRV